MVRSAGRSSTAAPSWRAPLPMRPIPATAMPMPPLSSIRRPATSTHIVNNGLIRAYAETARGGPAHAAGHVMYRILALVSSALKTVITNDGDIFAGISKDGGKTVLWGDAIDASDAPGPVLIQLFNSTPSHIFGNILTPGSRQWRDRRQSRPDLSQRAGQPRWTLAGQPRYPHLGKARLRESRPGQRGVRGLATDLHHARRKYARRRAYGQQRPDDFADVQTALSAHLHGERRQPSRQAVRRNPARHL